MIQQNNHIQARDGITCFLRKSLVDFHRKAYQMYGDILPACIKSRSLTLSHIARNLSGYEKDKHAIVLVQRESDREEHRVGRFSYQLSIIYTFQETYIELVTGVTEYLGKGESARTMTPHLVGVLTKIIGRVVARCLSIKVSVKNY